MLASGIERCPPWRTRRNAPAKRSGGPSLSTSSVRDHGLATPASGRSQPLAHAIFRPLPSIGFWYGQSDIGPFPEQA